MWDGGRVMLCCGGKGESTPSAQVDFLHRVDACPALAQHLDRKDVSSSCVAIETVGRIEYRRYSR